MTDSDLKFSLIEADNGEDNTNVQQDHNDAGEGFDVELEDLQGLPELESKRRWEEEAFWQLCAGLTSSLSEKT